MADQTYHLWDILAGCLDPYGARIHQAMGESVLAVFEAEQVHEDDAERAVQAAHAIRHAARPRAMELSAGINSGTVYMARQGSGADSAIVMGAVVNLRLVSTVFQNEIIASGRRVFCADEAVCDEFEALTLSFYQKLNAERAEILADFFRTKRAYPV